MATEPSAHSLAEPSAHSLAEPSAHSLAEPSAHSLAEPSAHSLAKPSAAPRWLELLPATAGSVLGSVGLIGLVLAILGVFSTSLALLLGLPVAGLAVFLVVRATGPGPTPDDRPTRDQARSSNLAAVAAVVLASAFLVVAAWAPSQHVLVNRDPGSYTTTARWLARDGSLEAPAPTGGLPGDAPFRVGSYAVHDTGDGAVQFQFNHLTSVALAVAHDVGGQRLLFRLPALVAAAALLAIYAAAVHATRRPWVALVAPALTAASMPVLHVARDTFSEPFTLLLLWSGLHVALIAVRSRHVGAAAVAGLLVGATVATRIDALLYVAIAFPLLAWHAAAGEHSAGWWDRRVRVAATMTLALCAAAAVGVADLELRSGGYASRHGEQVGLLRVLVGVSLVGSVAGLVLARSRPRWIQRLAVAARRLAVPVAALSVAVLVIGWLVRPHVQVMRGVDPVPLVGALQSSAGVPVDPFRRYGELTLEWLSWYLGPVAMVAGILGVGLVVHRTLRGRANDATIAVAALLAVAGGLYWWRPSIVPDQVWAMRRFVPAVLPAFAAMAALTVAQLAGWQRWRPPVRNGAAAVLAVVLVAGATTVTWPVRQLREQQGHLGVLLEGCELIGEDSSVVVVGAPAVDVLPQSLRSWCGVPVTSLVGEPTADQLAALRVSVSSAGRTLTWVSTDPTALDGVAPATSATSPEQERTGTAVETRQAERTLLRAPARYAPPGSGFTLFVRPDDT